MFYTYSITYKKTNTHYYGVRFKKSCKLEDLGTTYFSSSKSLKRLILQKGIHEFTFKIRRIFKTKKDAVLWEHKFLTRVNAKNSINFFNLTNGTIEGPPDLSGIKKSQLTLTRMSKPKSPEHRQKLKEHLDKVRIIPNWDDERKKLWSNKMLGNTLRKNKNPWNKGKTMENDSRITPRKGIPQKHGPRILILKKCPYCGIEGKGGNMTRYHFDNCSSYTLD